MSELIPSLFKKMTVSDPLLALIKKKSDGSDLLFSQANFLLFRSKKNEQFAQKTRVGNSKICFSIESMVSCDWTIDLIMKKID